MWPEVVEFALTLPGVVYADNFTFTCATDSLANMRQEIESENGSTVWWWPPAAPGPMNRLSWTICARPASINICFRWPISGTRIPGCTRESRKQATDKAKERLRWPWAGPGCWNPCIELPFPVTQQALVLGGGLAGLAAALTIADAGYRVDLPEQER